MKIIDLLIDLNKFQKEEILNMPKKIKYRGLIFYFNEEDDKGYYTEKPGHGGKSLLSLIYSMNDSVEILEDEKKIPERIKIEGKSITVKGTTFFREKDIEIFQKLSMEINEILDYLETKGE